MLIFTSYIPTFTCFMLIYQSLGIDLGLTWVDLGLTWVDLGLTWVDLGLTWG